MFSINAEAIDNSFSSDDPNGEYERRGVHRLLGNRRNPSL